MVGVEGLSSAASSGRPVSRRWYSMEDSAPEYVVLMRGLLHREELQLIWSGTLLFLKLPVLESSSGPLEEFELEMLPKDELLWLLVAVEPEEDWANGIGTGTKGVAMLHLNKSTKDYSVQALSGQEGK